MTSNEQTAIPTGHRAALNQIVARQIAPKSAYRITKVLSEYSDEDFMKVVAVANFYSEYGADETGVGGWISGGDIETVRIMAEHLDAMRTYETGINTFHALLRSLECLGILSPGADTFPDMDKHLEAESLSYFERKVYQNNEQLILFVQENLHRHEEVMKFMRDNKTQNIGLLRGKFYGEAPVLAEGTL